ncbi:hypothetical protein BDW02DRAFT_563858 [Decorospora gaudefroyi]|uniref:Uncharacterized protein n=1 Tax=Decorospora gaudefroyi TaxID=184978 RepID=A0A6A5KLI4_9PLEO|nr:hypothetical protein BDW02DRAFT_563858 [Decorospora gaudefroyi]
MNLVPLHDIKTNEPCEGFPRTIGDVSKMNVSDLDRVLTGLGAKYYDKQNEPLLRQWLVCIIKGRCQDIPNF